MKRLREIEEVFGEQFPEDKFPDTRIRPDFADQLASDGLRRQFLFCQFGGHGDFSGDLEIIAIQFSTFIGAAGPVWAMVTVHVSACRTPSKSPDAIIASNPKMPGPGSKRPAIDIPCLATTTTRDLKPAALSSEQLRTMYPSTRDYWFIIPDSWWCSRYERSKRSPVPVYPGAQQVHLQCWSRRARPFPNLRTSNSAWIVSPDSTSVQTVSVSTSRYWDTFPAASPT